MGKACLLKDQDTKVTGQTITFSYRSYKRRAGSLAQQVKGTGTVDFKTASFLFVGVVLGVPEKAESWSHPGVAGLFTPVQSFWYRNVQCLLDLFKVLANRGKS